MKCQAKTMATSVCPHEARYIACPQERVANDFEVCGLHAQWHSHDHHILPLTGSRFALSSEEITIAIAEVRS